MAFPQWSWIKTSKFAVGDKEPVARQAAIPAADATYDADVVNGIIAVLVAYGMVEEEE